MIFKVHYNSALLNSGKPNTYVSFCERKLNFSRLEMHNFLYRFLHDRKIINFPENMFSFEVNAGYSIYSCRTVKCYVSTDRKKWYCKLEQLMPVVGSNPNYAATDINILRQQIVAAITDTARRDMQEQIDAEIFRDINNAARVDPDYWVDGDGFVINAHRDFTINAVPNVSVNVVVNPAANLDAQLDEPIQIDHIDDE